MAVKTHKFIFLLALVTGYTNAIAGGVEPVQRAETCPEPERVLAGEVSEWWTEEDEAQVEISKRRCKELYGPKACLKTLTKLEPHRYTATCKR